MLSSVEGNLKLTIILTIQMVSLMTTSGVETCYCGNK